MRKFKDTEETGRIAAEHAAKTPRAIPGHVGEGAIPCPKAYCCPRVPGGACGIRQVGLARLGRAAALSLLAAGPPAPAATNDTLDLAAGIAVQHDDNLFRLSSNADASAVLGKPAKADDTTITTISLRLDKHLSLQSVELKASVSEHRYRSFDYLNYLARDYAATWHWQLTPYLHGNLSSDRAESLNSFIDYTGYRTRNLRTDENRRFDSVFEVGSAWRILAGVVQTTRTNSELFSQEGDNQLNSAEGGLRYDFRSGASLSVLKRNGRGEYFNRPQPLAASLLDNRFDQNEDEIRLHWPVTGKATLDLRAARIERTHAHFSERDFAGPVGTIGLNWKITDKTSLTASLGRELSSYQSVASSSIRTDRLMVSPSWQIGRKTTLRGRYDYARRDFRGAVAASPLADRFDTLHSALLALEWQPVQDLVLNASLQNDRRASNLPGYDYGSNMAAVSARFTF